MFFAGSSPLGEAPHLLGARGWEQDVLVEAPEQRRVHDVRAVRRADEDARRVAVEQRQQRVDDRVPLPPGCAVYCAALRADGVELVEDNERPLADAPEEVPQILARPADVDGQELGDRNAVRLDAEGIGQRRPHRSFPVPGRPVEQQSVPRSEPALGEVLAVLELDDDLVEASLQFRVEEEVREADG